jgi:RimJ/RimL family protein N-acetyltransferase
MLINDNLFMGKLVRLTALEPEKASELFSKWNRDSEYARMLDSDAARLWSAKKVKEWIEKELDEEDFFFFGIHSIADDRLIGFIDIYKPDWKNGDGMVGIGIGEREYWGKGYGTEAMRLFLQYAFLELNLRRVSLTFFEYNSRGYRSYLKAGFKEEGRLRGYLNREGQRWDLIYMGILREEWLELNQQAG